MREKGNDRKNIDKINFASFSILKGLKKNKKNQELPTCSKLFTEVVIFVAAKTFFQ